MNCMEVRALVEDALDESLAGSRRRALDLHLSRCDACRAFFDAERAEHRRWFLAMNEPMARRWLPQGFAEGFLAEVAERHAKPQRRWAFLAAFRRVAAVLVAMAIFAGLVYAATVGLRGTEAANQDTEAANQETEAAEGVSRLASDVSGLSESSAEPAAPDVSENQSTQPQGEQPMKRKKAAAVALAAAAVTMATAPLASANGDGYQFIDPETWPAENPSYSAKSAAIALEAGALSVASASGDLEARSRSKCPSNVIALESTKFHALMLIFR